MKITGILNFDCYSKRSSIQGMGAYATSGIPKRRKIGNMSGVIKPLKNVPTKFGKKASVSIVELDGGNVLDSRKFKNTLCFINHSCNPNCYLRIFGNLVEVYSLKKIKANEELTADYGETHHEGKLVCNCNAINCKGFL